MLDVLNKPETESPGIDRAGKRAKIIEALNAQPEASNRKIAERVGCDDKTVGRVRADLAANAAPWASETPHPANPPRFVPQTQREAALAAAMPPSAADNAAIAAASSSVEAFDWFTDNAVFLKRQPATAIYFNNNNDLVIRQEGEAGEEDSFVFISAPYQRQFIDKVRDLLGIGKLP